MYPSQERINQIYSILECIEYKDWMFKYYPSKSYLQIEFMAPCHDNPMNNSLQKSRKWLISEHMTDSEIVQTIFLAIKVAEEHEMRETFKFDGQCVFGPHFDVYALVAAIQDEAITEDRRDG